MVRRVFRRITEAILNADQTTINTWCISIDKEIEYAKKQAQVKEKILEAYDNDVQVKKLAEITGIPQGTIYGWVEARKKKEAESDAKTKTNS